MYSIVLLVFIGNTLFDLDYYSVLHFNQGVLRFAPSLHGKLDWAFDNTWMLVFTKNIKLVDLPYRWKFVETQTHTPGLSTSLCDDCVYKISNIVVGK